MSDKRKCYFIQETVRDEQGNYIPCIAIEGESGYYKTDWQWGNDLALAKSTANLMNKRLGISEEDAILIVLSSMFAKKGKRSKSR